jgi:spore maturation protein SpmA
LRKGVINAAGNVPTTRDIEESHQAYGFLMSRVAGTFFCLIDGALPSGPFVMESCWEGIINAAANVPATRDVEEPHQAYGFLMSRVAGTFFCLIDGASPRGPFVMESCWEGIINAAANVPATRDVEEPYQAYGFLMSRVAFYILLSH